MGNDNITTLVRALRFTALVAIDADGSRRTLLVFVQAAHLAAHLRCGGTEDVRSLPLGLQLSKLGNRVVRFPLAHRSSRNAEKSGNLGVGVEVELPAKLSLGEAVGHGERTLRGLKAGIKPPEAKGT
jgi:hypothetical protein